MRPKAPELVIGGDRLVRVARILGAHGVRGRVRLQSFLEDDAALGTLSPLRDGKGGTVSLSLEGVSGRALIGRIAGVETRDAAESLKGGELFAPRAALGETEADEYFAADLVGLTVVDGAGRVLGEVLAVAEFGAGPLLEVTPAEGGDTVFVPFTRAAVPEVDAVAGRVRVDLPPGLWPGH